MQEAEEMIYRDNEVGNFQSTAELEPKLKI